VGGTGLYFKSLTDGLVKIPNVPIKVRNEIRSLQKKLGQKKFYQKLIKLDPLVKNKINFNDVQRSIRAFEIKKFTKKSITKWFQNTKVLFDRDSFIKIYIDFSRTGLFERIIKRVDKMFEKGAITEVKKFNRLKVKKENSARKVIGIEEIGKYLKERRSYFNTLYLPLLLSEATAHANPIMLGSPINNKKSSSLKFLNFSFAFRTAGAGDNIICLPSSNRGTNSPYSLAGITLNFATSWITYTLPLFSDILIFLPHHIYFLFKCIN